ncbi:MAG TPA: hypothetical protein VF625_04140 [Longimicrobium sp.]
MPNVVDDPSAAPDAEHNDPPAMLRYFVAFLFIMYGFAKLMGSQFTILDSELDRPMGEVSGFWLTWYYFGYSPVYGSLLALAQIGSGLLLTFRRTTLLGAAILFGIASNIVLIDVFYGVDLGATVTAIILWVCLLVMLGYYRTRLLAVFWGARRPARSARRRYAAHAVRGTMVLFAVAATYYLANFNNRRPTPLDGTWDVAEARGFPGESQPSRIYFEHNRAFMTVFQYPGARVTHHFEVDPRRRTIQIWRDWLTRGDVVFGGTYTLSGDRLELQGRAGAAGSPARLRLARVRR